MGLLNWGQGLSELGAGVARTAGSMALEQQKSMLSEKAMVLADQLTTAREHTGRFEAADIAKGAENQRFGHETSLTGQRETAATGRTVLEGQNALLRTREQIAAQHQDVNTQVNKLPDEVRTANWFSSASPRDRQAYTQALLAKAGLPSWASEQLSDTPPTKEGSVAPTTSTAAAPKPLNQSDPYPVAGMEPPADNPEVAGKKPDDAKVPDITTTLDPKVKDANLPMSSITYNDDALKGMGADAGVVKMMVQGRLPTPSSFAMAKPYWSAMIKKANEYDPTFDATTWQSRVATRKSFAAGADAANVNSMNTALGHAERLYDNFDKMDNFGGVATPLNHVVNPLKSAFGNADVTKVETDIRILSSEARKVFAGTGGGGLEELRGWEKSFPVNGSPTQQKASLKEFSELLGSRLNEMANKYNRGMSTTEQPMELLNPKAKQAFLKISGEEPPKAIGTQLGGTPPASGGGTEGWSIRPIE